MEHTLKILESSSGIASVTALISAAAAIFALCLAWYTFRYTLRASARPVLVFNLGTDALWELSNVGTGPAISVVVGDKWLGEDWGKLVACRALPAGASTVLPWIHEGSELAASYTDIFDQSHVTRCKGGRNSISVGQIFSRRRPEWSEWELRVTQDTNLLINESDLEGKTAFELDVMRNEFYAKHGYAFQRLDLQRYFSAQSWYRPTTTDQWKVNRDLSASERNTALYILYYQNRRNLRVSGSAVL